MKCNFCGNEVAPGTTECPYCHYQFKIDTQVLSPDERDDFEGLTIEEDGSAREASYEERTGREIYDDTRGYEENHYDSQGPQVRVRTFGCGSGILMSLIILAVLCGIFIFALPAFVIFAAIGMVVVWIMRLLF